MASGALPLTLSSPPPQTYCVVRMTLVPFTVSPYSILTHLVLADFQGSLVSLKMYPPIFFDPFLSFFGGVPHFDPPLANHLSRISFSLLF